MTARLWDAKSKRLESMVYLGKKARSVAVRPDGGHVAVGCYDGHVKILSADLASEIADASPTPAWIEAIVYSPNNERLAVGAHDNKIYLLDTKTYSVREICKGHSSYITNMDFSVDCKYLQSTSGAYELLFWDATTGRQEKSSTAGRDVKWATFTSTLGWPVQGIWPTGSDMSDVNSADRNEDLSLIVTGDDFRRVKLFSYPAVRESQGFKGHRSTCQMYVLARMVSRYSVGLDKAVMQYEVVSTRTVK